MRPRPKALSSAADFGLDLPMLNTTTPRVTTRTWRYWDVGYFLPAATPPIMTGTILQDLPRTCVAKETYRSASFPVAIASICDTPLTRISRIGTSMPVRPNAAHPSAPTTVFTALSTSNTRKVWVNFSPLGPCLVAYTSSCITANVENAKKIPPTASASFASLCLPLDGPPVAVVAGLDADAPILIDRALALVALSEAMYVGVTLAPSACGKTSRLMMLARARLPEAAGSFVKARGKREILNRRFRVKIQPCETCTAACEFRTFRTNSSRRDKIMCEMCEIRTQMCRFRRVIF